MKVISDLTKAVLVELVGLQPTRVGSRRDGRNWRKSAQTTLSRTFAVKESREE